MLRGDELEQLQAIAQKAEEPVGTIAYRFVAQALRRLRRRT
jgi:hypothetical protein